MSFLASSASVAPFAIDYGRRSVRLLQVCKADHAYQCSAGAEIPGWVLAAADGPERPDDLSARLREIISQCGFLGETCSLTLPAEVFQCDTARLPVMPDAELRQSVEFEAADRFGIDKAAAVLGYTRLGQPLAGQQDVLIMAVPRTAIDAAVKPTKAAGLATIHLENAAFASLRAVARQRRAEIADVNEATNFAMIHLEDRIATLIVVHDAIPTMVRCVLGDWAPINTTIHRTGGDRVSVAAAATRPQSGDTAIAIAVEPDAGAHAPTNTRMQASVHTGIHTGPHTGVHVNPATMIQSGIQSPEDWRWCSLAEETLRCLRHLERTLGGWWPTRLVITGPSACDPQVVSTMESVCGLNAELAVPIRLIESPTACVHGNRWIATIGSAIAELPPLAANRTAAAAPAPEPQGAAA